jgi:hypothetical protein
VGIQNALLGLWSRPISSVSAGLGKRASRSRSSARQRSAPTGAPVSTGVVLTGITLVVRTRPFVTKHRVRRRREGAFDLGCRQTPTTSPWIRRSIDQVGRYVIAISALSGYLASAELYDPSSGIFSPTGLLRPIAQDIFSGDGLAQDPTVI